MKIFKRILIAGIVIMVCALAFIYTFNGKVTNDLAIKNWDNIYNEDGIEFFYSNSSDEKIKVLKDNYNLEEKVKGVDGQLNKAIKIAEYLGSIITFDDVPSTSRINGFDILKEKIGEKKVSAKDLGIIYRDFLESLGYTARVGEFKRMNVGSNKEKSYYVVEYWSKEYNKWVMIDFIDKGYFDNEGFPCSAMEVLENDIRNYNYTGSSNRSDYIPMLKKTLYTYTINIDNTTDMKRSNSYITYIKDKDSIALKFKGNYLGPTIFTENKDLINKNPIDSTVSKDEKAYLILMKKQEKTEDKDNKEQSFIVGAFKDGKILEEYYLKENDNEYRKVNMYTDILFNEGDNIISLSLDGEKTVTSIEIKN